MSGILEVPKTRVRQEEYDALAGIWTRKPKEKDIVHIASNGSTQPGSDGDFTLASTTLDANHEAFVHAFAFGASTAADLVMVAGTSTILPTRLASAGQGNAVFAPHWLFRVPPSTAVSLIAVGASSNESYNGWASLNQIPIPAKLETETGA